MTITTKRIVCLGLSRKYKNYCIVGKTLDTNKQFIRLITDNNTRCISPSTCILDNNKKLQLLDIIDVPLAEHCPAGCHSENYTIAPGLPWKYVGTYGPENLDEFIDYPSSLWDNKYSSFYGINDKIDYVHTNSYSSSAFFIKLDLLNIKVQFEDSLNGYSRKRVRGNFTYNGTMYQFVITDIAIENFYKEKNCNTYTIEGPLYATISLSENFNGHRYKLLVSVITM